MGQTVSVHRGGVGGDNFHAVLHPHPALVVVDTVQPQDRFLHIPHHQGLKVLYTWGVGISPRFPLLGCHLNPTLPTPEGVADPSLLQSPPCSPLQEKHLGWPHFSADHGFNPRNFFSKETHPFPIILNSTFLPWLFSASFSFILLSSLLNHLFFVLGLPPMIFIVVPYSKCDSYQICV